MAPARTKDTSDDPVTASYDIYLTPSQQEQIYLVQYPNRLRERPYSARQGSRPSALRLKPKTGHIELDIPLNTEHNFNKYAGLKWGESLRTAKDIQNETSTYGLAGGLGPPKGGPQAAARRLATNGGEMERENEVQNRLQRFYDAERDGNVMNVQTLGGQIVRHNGAGEEDGKPWYFVGAFKGDQLHLTRVEGTAQMRPQVHHVDAEAQRDKLLASRGAGDASASDVRAINQRLRDMPSSNPKGELEAREAEMEKALQDAREEEWVPLRYVDEDDQEAYEVWEGRMFVPETEKAVGLKSGMDDDAFLDAISAPGRGSPTRRRRRARSKKDRDFEDLEELGAGDDGEEMSEDAPPKPHQSRDGYVPQMDQSPLLRLPPEIRNAVYRDVLVTYEDIRVSRLVDEGVEADHRWGAPTLLQTCQQIREEARSIYYEFNTFSFQSSLRMGDVRSFCDRTLSMWLILLGQKTRSLLRRRRLDDSFHCTGEDERIANCRRLLRQKAVAVPAAKIEVEVEGGG